MTHFGTEKIFFINILENLLYCWKTKYYLEGLIYNIKHLKCLFPTNKLFLFEDLWRNYPHVTNIIRKGGKGQFLRNISHTLSDDILSSSPHREYDAVQYWQPGHHQPGADGALGDKQRDL